ncbi:energy transducer TonB [Pararobbsia silviterrae]|uniref:Protein TonB n=2 Tax=Pararobbsia silviterrae TaxID=1792498 RepID=A0A494Y7S5_9BURK|nr:energy transducer TonB [Pararobbsia silviterrae]
MAAHAPPRRPRAVSAKVGAALVALLLHAALVVLAMHVQRDVLLTSHAAPGGALRVTLVSRAQPPVPQPPKPQIQKPMTHPNVLATHHAAMRQIAALDPTPVVKEPPVVTPPTPPQPHASAPPATPAPSAAMPLPVPGDAGKHANLICDIPAPPYPSRARRLGHEGTVELAVNIDASGRITDAQVKKSSGYDDLDDAAVQAMLAGHCDPLMQAGHPVSTSAVQPLSFHLDH